jgi:hypothetical protein
MAATTGTRRISLSAGVTKLNYLSPSVAEGKKGEVVL